MFRSASRSFFSLYSTGSACSARFFHRVTTDFINYDARGDLVVRKVPIIIGNPGEAYILIDPGVGSALRAASPFTSASIRAEDRCSLTFFHDSRHFGFGKLSARESPIRRVLTSLFFDARIIELPPSLYPKPNTSPNRFRYEPCNFVLEWENARDSSRWYT
jgi:hypothetical protein